MLCLDSKDKPVWFVVPAYNEAQVIGDTVRDVLAHCPNVVVVDDGSNDDTTARSESAGANTVIHSLNLGQGAAIQTGIDYALQRGAEFIFTFDADGQHQASDAVQMLELMQEKGSEVVLGSRFLGSAEGIPAARASLLKFSVWFLRRSTRLKLTDNHNGFRLFRASLARQLNIQHDGMAHASEILATISNLGASYTEAPVHVRYSEYSLGKGQRLSNSLHILSELFIKHFSK